MICSNCKNPFRIQPRETDITLMCKCQCIIIYPDGYTTRKTKEQYLEFKKRKEDYNPKHKTK